jgi:hypothetical protein
VSLRMTAELPSVAMAVSLSRSVRTLSFPSRP